MKHENGRNCMLVRIVSPQGTVYEHRAFACNVQSTDGGLTIMPGHMPILVALAISDVKVTRTQVGEPIDHIAINGGVLEMRDNICEIISNDALRARDIDETKVLDAQAQAQAQLMAADAKGDKIAYQKAEIELSRALNMMKVSKFRRN